MNTYMITGFEGLWPVGTAAVVVARDRGHAKRLLNATLASRGLKLVEDTKEFKLLDTSQEGAYVLLDGEY